jgi:ATP-dependent helicase/nuclease subunit B
VAWTGPFQPTLEAAWQASLARIRATDPLATVWLLVPSRFLGHHLVRLAARAGGAVNLHVLTFTDLADRLLAGGATGSARRLPRVGDTLVLRQALREAVPADGYFASVRDARRLPGALAATLAELRIAGVRPDDLDATARGLEADGASAGAAKLREVARIARHAEAALGAAGFVHPTDLLWAAARSGDATVLASCAWLAVYGFIDWNGAERALLRAVTARVATTCFVPAEPGPPFEPLEGLLAWLAGEGFGVERGEPTRDGPRMLVSRLFHPVAAPGAGTAGLEVVAAPGEERETREIARRLLAAAADGIPFESMGILVRRPDSYRSAVRDVFGAAGIPYTWGVAPRLGDTRAGRALRLLVAARQDDFARSAVVELLATASLRLPREGEHVEPAEWDRLSREAGVVGGRADWRRGLGRLLRRVQAAADRPPVEDDEGRVAPRAPTAAAVQALGRVVGRLLDGAGAIPDSGPAAQLARGFLRVFLRLCRRDPETEQVGAVLASLESLAPLAAPLSLEEFGDLLDAALDIPVEPSPEPRHGKVFVGELHQALGLPFRLVVIPGLVEQGFPVPPRVDPILSDDERRRLAAAPGGRPGLALAARQPAEERLAFRLAAAAAEERLLLSYPRIDPGSGRPRVPSFFLLRVAEAATGEPHDFSRLETAFPPLRRVPLVPAPLDAIAAPLDAREWLLAQATAARAGGAAGHAACLAGLPQATRGRQALLAREHGDRVGPWDGLLPDDLQAGLAHAHRPTDAPVAATPLEAYATCPFRYYLAHVLHLAPAVEPERVLTMAPADRGRLLHAVLARAYGAFRDARLLPLDPERLPAARALVETAFTEIEASFGARGLAPFWQGERTRLVNDILAALDAEAREGGWVPTAFEVAFGAAAEGTEGAPPVALTLASGPRLTFHGRLDRLDVSVDGTRVRVIDYKSGRAPRVAGARLAGGTALQLPIYRLAAEGLCRARGVEARVEEAQYYHLTRRGERRRLRFTADDWTARRPDFEQALEIVLEGIARGRFFQNPSPETCRACDYPVACGPQRERIAWVERKLGDPARDDYVRLQAIE